MLEDTLLKNPASKPPNRFRDKSRLTSLGRASMSPGWRSVRRLELRFSFSRCSVPWKILGDTETNP